MASSSAVFPCAICFDTASDPVVTRCGHLFCWPCLERWLHGGQRQNLDCPVCKGRVDERIDGDIIPLYGVGNGSSSHRSEAGAHPCPSSSSEATHQRSQSGQQQQQQQRTHAFHNRSQRPHPQDVPGPRRYGRWFNSIPRATFLGGPVLVAGDPLMMLGFLAIWLLILVYPTLRRCRASWARRFWRWWSTRGGNVQRESNEEPSPHSSYSHEALRNPQPDDVLQFSLWIAIASACLFLILGASGIGTKKNTFE